MVTNPAVRVMFGFILWARELIVSRIQVKEVADLILKNFVVAFLDVQGQQEHLGRLSLLPQGQDELDSTIAVLQDTLGVVLDIRKKFNNSIDRYRTVRICDPNDLPENLRHLAQLELDVFYFSFSDSFILAVPLGESDSSHNALAAVRFILSACGSMMLDAFTVGRAVRGGIDLSLGVQLEDGELYGPAVARAYALESKAAEYPRILIGDTLREFLADQASTEPTEPEEDFAKIMAAKSLTKIAEDDDGRMVLDYLGGGFLPPDEHIGKMSDHVRVALGFVRAERERFVRLKNHKLAGRYSWLLRYFNSRIHLWGLSNTIESS